MMKKFNKILSLLMAFAMVLTMLPTSAIAVVRGNESTVKNDSKYVEGLPVGDRDVMNSLRENYPEQAVENGLVIEGNGFTVTESNNPLATLDKDTEADQLVARFEQDEIVRVIVVLEGEPLLDQGFTTEEIAANGGEVAYQVSIMHNVQDTLMGDINVLVQNVMPDAYTGEIEAKYNYSITMNGVAIEVPFGVVDEIAEMDGVEAAYVAPQYTVPEDMTDTAAPSMVSTKDLAGSALSWDLGYTGAGMRIAVIDTGLDVDHPSFNINDPAYIGEFPTTETSLTIDEINQVLKDLNAYQQYAGLTAKNLYLTAKIPFHFNYVDQDLDVTHDYDSAGDHGTHVAGIAAANKIKGTEVVGVAPDAQLIPMKVFGKNGGAYWDDIVAALEDCFRLNVDAINMSLGSPSGFTWESDDLTIQFVEVMARIEQSDMIASVSAGNSYSAGCSNFWYEFMMGYGLQSEFPELVPGHNQTIDPAIGVVSSPATFFGATVVASLENDTTAAEVMIATDGYEEYQFAFGDNYTYFTYYLGGNGDFKEHEYDYVVIPGYGDESDYEGLDVTGKVVLVERGELAFTDKQTIAAEMGAVGIIVYNNTNEADIFYMQNAGKIPNVTVTRADGLKLIELAGNDGVGTLIVKYNRVIIAENAIAGVMSDFSSWGVTPDLRLVPDLTSYGGNIFSTYTDGEYGIMSGTSMSAPHVAGMAALVLQYLRDSGYEVLATEADYHLVAEALLMSTAEPVVEPSGILYSPRKQGAGNANIYDAITSPVYLTVGGAKPSVSFGDDDSRRGTYTFTFELNNLTGEAQTYALDATVLTDQFHEGFAELTGVYLMGETSRELDAKVRFESAKYSNGVYLDYNGDYAMDLDDVLAFLIDVNRERVSGEKYDLNSDGVVNTADVQVLYNTVFTAHSNVINKITVPANESVSVNVIITLSDADMAYMDAYYPNGIYVEGFVRCYADNSDNCDLSLPFMGFYGDWSDARTFDTYSWYHEGMQLPERYASILWVDSTNGIGAGGNPYETSLQGRDPNYESELRDPMVSPNGDGSYDYIDDIYLSLMRNAKLIEFIWTDEDGNILFQRDAEYARQSSYQSGYGSIVPFVYSWWFEDAYEFVDENGKALPDGTEVTLTINFYQDDGDDIMDDTTSAVITVDSTYPEIVDIDLIYDEETNERLIDVTFTDNDDIAAVAMMTRTGSIIEMIKPETVRYKGGVSASVTFDASEMDSEFVLVVGDYAGNERYYNIDFAGNGTNVRPDSFYAYRSMMNYDAGNGYIYLMDAYNGWHSFKSDDAVSSLWMHTGKYSDGENDVVAADYVDGYVIGIDSANQIFAMKAGEWTRMPFGTFEIDGELYTVLDMAYDFKNEIMYVLTDELSAGMGGHLASLDILTGEVTDLGVIEFAAGTDVQALTLACDNDGVLYTISYVAGAVEGNEYTGDLYTIDPVTLTASYVGETGYLPDYRQSMTVDHDTNRLYWMAYGNPYSTDPYYGDDKADDEDYIEDPEASGPATFVEVNKKTGELTVVSDVQYNSEMVALYKPYLGSRDIIKNAALKRLDLNKTSYSMSAGVTLKLSALPYPYYAELGEIEWSTSDPAVAVVDENGNVTAIGEGSAVITAKSGNVTAACEINVSKHAAELTFYEMMNGMGWANLNAGAPADMTYITEYGMEYFTAAAYYDGYVYAYDAMTYALYRLDAETMKGTQVGVCSTYIVGMAFNYADGFMYGVAQAGDYFDSWYELIRINPNTGETVTVAKMPEGFSPTHGIAIDYEGNFYSLGHLNEGSGWYAEYLGYFMMKWTVDGDEIVDVTRYDMNDYVFYGSGSSMAYADIDHGVYYFDDMGKLFWIDTENLPESGMAPTISDLGYISNFEEIGYAMNYSLFTVPAVEPELPYVAAEDVELPDSYMVLEGGMVSNGVTLLPWNATADISIATADPEIAYADGDGNIIGRMAGTTTVIVTAGGSTYQREVTVCESTGGLSGYMLTDFGYGGEVFISFSDLDPTNEISENAYITEFTLFSGAYFNGKLYAYGQDATGARGYYYYLLEIDAYTYEYEVIDRVSYTLRDMAFDYTTGNMYAIAEGGEYNGAVVQIDIETAELSIIAETGVTFAAMTIDANGQMYGIGEDDYLYTIDKYTGFAKPVGHTGADAGQLFQSMHYDLDTGNVYWAQVNKNQLSSLRLVDLETGVSTGLGMICPTGSEVVMLYTIPENEPTEPTGEVVATGIQVDELNTTYVGGTVQLDFTVLTEVELKTPGTSENGDASTNSIGGMPTNASVVWTSSDEKVATVDENGVVTGVSEGVAYITATIGEYSDTCKVTITKEARKYFAYDATNRQWISFDGETTDSYGNLEVDVERKDAEGETALKSTFYVQETDSVYAVDEFGAVYSIDPDTFVRTIMNIEFGTTYTANVEAFSYDIWDYVEVEVECELKPVDMSYDNGKLYALFIATNDEYYVEMTIIYEIDLATGDSKVVYESEDIRAANLYVKDGRAFMVDGMVSGMISFVDLYADEQELVQSVLIKIYWGDPWSGVALFEDTLTGTMYVIRDMTDTGANEWQVDDEGNWELVYLWDGVTGDSNLYIVGLTDGSMERIGEIGNNIIIRGMFLR